MPSVVLENAAFADVVKRANIAAASRGANYELAKGVVISNRDGVVTVRATDLNTFYREWTRPISVGSDDFTWRVSSKLLSAIVSSLPIRGENRTSEITQDGGRLRISCGRLKASLPLMPVESYPDWETFDPDVVGPVSNLGRALDMVSWACSNNADGAIEGVHFTGKALIATNRFRIAAAEFALPTEEAFTIPVSVLGPLIKGFGGECRVAFVDKRLLILPNNYIQILVVCYDEQYPPITSIMQKQIGPDTFEVGKDELLGVVKRAQPLSNTDRSPGIFVTIGQGELAAHAETEKDAAVLGDVIEVPGYLNHPRVKYWFVPENFVNAIEAAPDNTVTVTYWLDQLAKAWVISCGSYYSAWVLPRTTSTV